MGTADQVRHDVDELVRWYEQYKPTAGQRIPVKTTPKVLAQAFGYMRVKDGWPKEVAYRGRTIVATEMQA